MTTYFTSDTHIGHKNVLHLSKRDFLTIEAMNEQIILNWNSVVQADDTIYHLGDFSFRHQKGSLRPIFNRLNGIKHLLIGNHDTDEVKHLPWESVEIYRKIEIGDKKVVLCHYPFRSWDGMYRGSLHLYGHEHGNVTDHENCLDVGVDKWNYTPCSFEQILARMETLPKWHAKPPKEEM